MGYPRIHTDPLGGVMTIERIMPKKSGFLQGSARIVARNFSGATDLPPWK